MWPWRSLIWLWISELYLYFTLQKYTKWTKACELPDCFQTFSEFSLTKTNHIFINTFWGALTLKTDRHLIFLIVLIAQTCLSPCSTDKRARQHCKYCKSNVNLQDHSCHQKCSVSLLQNLLPSEINRWSRRETLHSWTARFCSRTTVTSCSNRWFTESDGEDLDWPIWTSEMNVTIVPSDCVCLVIKLSPEVT